MITFVDLLENEIKQGDIVSVATSKYSMQIGVAKCLGWSTLHNRYNGISVATGLYDTRLRGFTVTNFYETGTQDKYSVPGILILSPTLKLTNDWQPIIDRCVGIAWNREAIKPKADGSKIFHLLTSMKSYYNGYGWSANGNLSQKSGQVETTNGLLHVKVVKYSNSDIRVEFTLDKIPLKLEGLVLQFNLDPNGLLKRIEALKESMKK